VIRRVLPSSFPGASRLGRMLGLLWRRARPSNLIACPGTRALSAQRLVAQGAAHNGRAKLGACSYASLASTMPPSSSTSAAHDSSASFGNFDLVRRFKLDYTDVDVSKWRSRVTGLGVVHLDYDGTSHVLLCICEILMPIIQLQLLTGTLSCQPRVRFIYTMSIHNIGLHMHSLQ
jgi:hypothetical protein